MALLTHIDGPVDADRLAEAFASVVAASDVLRSRITEHDGTPLVTHDAEPQQPELIDLDRSEARAWAGKRVSTPIDLAVRGYDSVILCHIDGTVSWYLALHHVITDATASALVFEATAAAYHGEQVRPASYAEWARSLDHPGDEATARRRDRALAHWRDRAAAPVPNRLYRPVGRPRPEAARLPVPLGPELLATIQRRIGDDLRMLSPDLGWTALLMTITAAYLHHIAGADSLAIGLPVHNRSDGSTRDLIGPVMEVFPVDVTIDADDTFRSLHKRTSRALLTTLSQAVPGTAPAADHGAVINVIPRGAVGPFGSIPTSTDWIHAGAIDSSHLLRVQLTAYEGGLADQIEPPATEALDDGLRLAIDVNRAAAGDDHLGRAAGHFHDLLAAAVDDPDRPITTELLDRDERRLLRSWESSPDLPADEDRPEGSLVARLRAALSDRTTPALHHHHRALTGEELWRRVDHLARWLRYRGVGATDGAVTRVGIELPRSADAVIAVLAVLAAGGSFVPLDPRQPATRRDALARRAGCVLVLTELPPEADDPGLDLPALDDPQLADPKPDDEAYLLFTSGSTGEPKGVPITHRGIDRYLRFAAANYLDRHPASPDGRQSRDLVVPLFSSLTFDLTLTSLFLPLLEGGELVMIEADGPAALTELAGQRRVNWCKATPSHLEVLSRILPADHRLATIVVGGEAFGAGLARRLLGRRADLAIFNEYGPTEAVVGCMIHRVDPGRLGDQPEVPIGQPAPGVTLRVVGPGLQRLPIGAAGELLIASPGLTTGYLGTGDQVESVDEAQPDDGGPFVELDGQRFYRSGDLVRLADPETAVYLGRIDDQVKVGGIRLEPTEVEEALVAHPAIAGAAVRLWQPRPTEPDRHCVRCGLASNVPGADIDDGGVCRTCHDHDRVEPQTRSWFRTPEDLAAKRAEARRRRTGDHDCLHLLSGGKDSTYALYRLVELGFRPYALTLDNGFISEGAKENVRRTVADLGIDHEFATTDAMNDIFRDSLERHSNVCHGCYKTIYTLATTRAVELGIPLIVTGLSRGQLFETRLIPAQFRAERFDPDAIDRAVVEARKTYHRIDDGPNRLLDTSVFTSDDVFDQVEYLDFYRYVDVELADMLSFLEDQAPWVRPADTGRSTNCLINAAGIHTHLQEQGYHNYAIPYAWDVRLGHKTREEAIDELDDQLDLADVERMLTDVGYSPNPRQVLSAWIVPEGLPGGEAAPVPSPAELRTFLAASLPTHAVPSAFVTVGGLPLTANGKLDADALPAPERTHRSSSGVTVEAETELEARVVAIWERVLGTEPISVDDDFFALGGDSLAALEMVVAVGEATGIELADDAPFLHTTPRALAEVLAAAESGAGRAATDHAPRPLGPWTDDDPPPLSTGERAILFEQSRHPGSPLYNVGRVFRVDGPVDGERLTTAVRAVAARHVPLSWSYGSPRRRLTPEEAVSADVRREPVDADRLDEVLTEPHRAPFELEHGPLLRVVVQPVTDGTTAVLLACHHVSGDADSFDRLWHQIDTELSGGQAPVPAVDYPSFTRWQADGIDEIAATATESDGDNSGRSRWVPTGPAPAGAAIVPPEQPEPDGLRTRTATVVPAELRARGGATGFALALAAVVATLRRHLDGDRVSLAMVTSGRDHPAAEDLFGYFLNNLPIDLDCPLDLSIDELVDLAGDASARNLSARSYPWARIVDERRRAGVAPPPLEVMLTYEDLSPTRLQGASVEQHVLHAGDAVTDVTFFVQIVDGDDRQGAGPRIDLSIEYRGSILGRDQAERILDHLDAALTAAVRHPATTVAEVESPGPISLLDGGPLEAPATLLGDILEHARRRPGDEAVRCGDRRLSWSELDRTSARLARRLRLAGIGTGDRVIIHLPRSVEVITAILGTLRAGAAYVPVDPGYPPDRIDRIVEGAGAAAAIAGGGPRPSGALAELPVLIELTGHGDEWGDPSGPSADGTTPATDESGLDQASGDDEAYVIFTSGSTGVPQGVAVRHRHLAASTAARASVYPEEPERFLMVSSPAFDSSIVGLFWTLATGGSVVVPTERQAHDPDGLATLLGDDGVTHTLLVPTLYQAVLDRGRSQPGWPERVIVAGEACPPSLVDLHGRLRPDTRLTNEYGPTEASVWATAHHLSPGEHPVPIGRPVPGTWVAVVDGTGRPVPTGVEGELIIGGAGVVDGYLDDPEATAARFGAGERGRFFRTGDRAAVVDWTVLFLGRIDDQLNVGGARVEPEDIERVLAADPAVGAVIVTATDPRSLAELIDATEPPVLGPAMERAGRASDPAADLRRRLREAGGGHRRLMANIEPAPDATPDLATLRALATDRLPPPLRPSLYAVHDSLPRTPNGKLDRGAASELVLDGPAPADRPPFDRRPIADHTGGDSTHDDLAGGDDAHQPLVAGMQELFASVLQADRVGPDGSFFDLGGHSLLALELLATLEDRHGVEVSVASLYDRPTPAGVADLVRRWRTGPTAATGGTASDSADDQYRYLIPIQPDGDRAPIFGVHVLGRNCEFYRPLAAHLGPDQPVYGLGLTDARPAASDPADIAEVAMRYADELERCHPSGPVSLAAVSMGSTVAFELARQLRARGREVALLAMFDAAGPDAEQLALTRGERLTAHARSLWDDPTRWTRNTGYRVRSRAERAAQRAAVWGRQRLGMPMTDDLRIREFVEANWRSQQAYRYEPYPGHVVVFKAADDPFLSRLATEGMGWARIMTGPFEVETVDGGHLSMLAEPHVAGLATRLAARHATAVDDLAPLPGHDGAPGEPTGFDEVEASLRRSLGSGRLAIGVGRLSNRLDQLEPPAADLVRRTDTTLRSLAERSREQARTAAAALAEAGIEVRIDPVPERSPWVRASLRLRLDDRTGPEAARLVERSCAALAVHGYRPQHHPDLVQSADTDLGNDDPWARLVTAAPSCTLIRADDHTSRIDLVWRSGLPPTDDPVDTARTNRTGRTGADDLGVFLGTPPGLARAVLALADPGPDDVVLDIGCGDGRILVEAVRHFGCRARGIEIDPALGAAARRRVNKAGLDDRIEIVVGDGSTVDLSTAYGPATVVFLFLPPERISSLLPRVLDQLGPGGRVVAHEQLAVDHPVEPTRSRLVVEDGVTVAHLWTR